MEDQVPADPMEEQRCGHRDLSRYVSNHAFNQSAGKQASRFRAGRHAGRRGLEARASAHPWRLAGARGPGALREEGDPGGSLRLLYLCPAGSGAAVQWSRVSRRASTPTGSAACGWRNFSVCPGAGGRGLRHVQVVFATKKELPLLVIVAVSVFPLVLATVPGRRLLPSAGQTPRQKRPYRLILRPQAPTPMEKRIAADFDPRASYLESEKSYPAGGEAGEEEPEGAPGRASTKTRSRGTPLGTCRRGEPGGLLAGGVPIKANQEEFEAGSVQPAAPGCRSGRHR